MNIREYLEENILLTDGAMGTYFSEKTGGNISFCELANINSPKIIEEIHIEYIEAGAKLIRTNTFSANIITLSKSREEVKEIIKTGYDIAINASKNREVFIGCSIGPLHESKELREDVDVIEEYKFIVDSFIEQGGNIFIFETFGSYEYLEEISKYIKEKNKEYFVLVQFAITGDGFTRKGISINSIIEKISNTKTIDAFGFNCGVGPTHMYRILEKHEIFDNIISVLPNASYPEIVNGRMVYLKNPEYFSEVMEDIAKLGAKIIGGCCGTTPEHIYKISEKLENENIKKEKLIIEKKNEKKEQPNLLNEFKVKLDSGKFIIAVELDPPFNNSVEKMMESARIAKTENIDLITVADSPRGIARIDSITVAAKIKREIGIETIPHVCCRDKNLNGLKSGILGAHIEGIRNILAITGDPVLDIDKKYIKGVFDVNSYELINLIREMNEEVFLDDDIEISGALNLNVVNKESQIKRLIKKVEKGANIFFTQPIFTDDSFEYIEKIRKETKAKILVGIMPVVSYKNAIFLNNEVPGIDVPEAQVEFFKKAVTKEESEQIGIDISINIIRKIKDKVDGIYFIAPFGRIDIIQKIIKKIEL